MTIQGMHTIVPGLSSETADREEPAHCRLVIERLYGKYSFYRGGAWTKLYAEGKAF